MENLKGYLAAGAFGAFLALSILYMIVAQTPVSV